MAPRPFRCVVHGPVVTLLFGSAATQHAALSRLECFYESEKHANVYLTREEAARELFGAVILRPAGIYGPGRDRLIRTVLERRPVEHGRRTNRIHEVDLARAILALLSSPAPPALLHATDGAPALLGEVVAHLAQRLGVPAPPRTSQDPGAGTVLDATALHELLGELEFPDFRAGYDAML